MQQLLQALDYRLAVLKAAHELEFRLKQEYEAEAHRVLKEAAREAMEAVMRASPRPTPASRQATADLGSYPPPPASALAPI